MPYGYVAVLYQRVGKLYAGRLADLHGSGGAGEQSGFGIALVHLYPVVVAACHKQVFAVRRYGKVTRVFASVLVSDFFERAVGLDFEYCYAVVFQPYACVQELAVGAYVNVGSAACRWLLQPVFA